MKYWKKQTSFNKAGIIVSLCGITCCITAILYMNKAQQPELVSFEFYMKQAESSKELSTPSTILDSESATPLINNNVQKAVEVSGENNTFLVENSEADKIRININTATSEQLQTLKGIGPSKAKAIIEEREKGGPFKTIEEIKRVKGIGEKTFEAIKERLVN